MAAAADASSEEQLRDAREQQQKDYEAPSRKLEPRNNARSARRAPANRATRLRSDVAALAGGERRSDARVQLMQTDPDYDVRIAATNALGTLGGGRPPGGAEHRGHAAPAAVRGAAQRRRRRSWRTR